MKQRSFRRVIHRMKVLARQKLADELLKAEQQYSAELEAILDTIIRDMEPEASEPFERTLQIRVSAEQYASFEQAAKNDNRSLSSWARHRLTACAESEAISMGCAAIAKEGAP